MCHRDGAKTELVWPWRVGESGGGGGQDGAVGPVSGRGAGPSMAPLSPGQRGLRHPRHLQHAGGVCRALPQLLPSPVLVGVRVCVG